MGKALTLQEIQERYRKKSPNIEVLQVDGIHKDDLVYFLCHACNQQYTKRRDTALKRFCCPICTSQTIIKGVNDIGTTHPDLIKHFSNEEDAYKYSAGSKQEILMECPECKSKKKYKINLLTRYGRFPCDKCSEGLSFPNRFLHNLLPELVSEYKFEYTDDWTQGKYYDAYFQLNNKKYLIEIDGSYHFKPSGWKGEEGYKQTLENDSLKEQLAKENNYILIRIPADYKHDERFSYLKEQVLKSELNNLFDLSKINWDSLKERCSDSLIKKVCDYYNNNPFQTYSEIGSFFNLHSDTIVNYLKTGRTLGLIKFSEEEEAIIKQEKNKRKGQKARIIREINIYDAKTGEYICSQNTVLDCVEYLQEHYPSDKAYYQANINKVLKGQLKSTHNFIFRHADESAKDTLQKEERSFCANCPIEVYLNNEEHTFIGAFDSITSCSKQMRLGNNRIGEAIKANKPYKGFIFKKQ